MALESEAFSIGDLSLEAREDKAYEAKLDYDRECALRSDLEYAMEQLGVNLAIEELQERVQELAKYGHEHVDIKDYL